MVRTIIVLATSLVTIGLFVTACIVFCRKFRFSCAAATIGSIHLTAVLVNAWMIENERPTK